MSAVVEFISDAVETVVDAVGDVVEAVGDFVSDAVEKVGDVVQAVIDDPLPVLLSVAGTFVGIPPMITNAAVTAARGGDLEDIVLSAGTAYFAPAATNAISSTLSSTIGSSIINETVSNVVVDGISKGLVNGVVSEVRGGDFDDGFAGAFTGTIVGAGVTEVSNFVSDNVLADLPDMGQFGDQFGNITQKALTSGVTAELTGRGDFDVAFTNSMINGTANLGANYITSSISDQFKATIDTEFEIVGSEEGSEEKRALLNSELDDAWAKTSGAVGTGAGIPDEIVDQVQVSELGYETPNTQEDPLMAESMGQDALDTGLTGYSASTATLNAAPEAEDVSDLAMEYGEEVPTEDFAISESYTEPNLAENQDLMEQYGMPEQLGVSAEVPEQPEMAAQESMMPPEEAPLYQERVLPVGGLGAVAQAPDVYEGVTDSLITPKTNESVIDVAGKPDEKVAGLNALASKFMPAGGGQAVVSGALNQILKPALRQGITKALRGAPARPVVRRPAPRTAPSRMTPMQVTAARQAQPVQAPVQASVAPTPKRVAPPKKRDIATLTPVTNIAGLTSLLKNKG